MPTSTDLERGSDAWFSNLKAGLTASLLSLENQIAGLADDLTARRTAGPITTSRPTERKRTLTPLPPLRSHHQLGEWCSKLHHSLAEHNLNRYINDDVPLPVEEPERRIWEDDVRDISWLIIDSVDGSIMRSHG